MTGDARFSVPGAPRLVMSAVGTDGTVRSSGAVVVAVGAARRVAVSAYVGSPASAHSASVSIPAAATLTMDGVSSGGVAVALAVAPGVAMRAAQSYDVDVAFAGMPTMMMNAGLTAEFSVNLRLALTQNWQPGAPRDGAASAAYAVQNALNVGTSAGNSASDIAHGIALASNSSNSATDSGTIYAHLTSFPQGNLSGANYAHIEGNLESQAISSMTALPPFQSVVTNGSVAATTTTATAPVTGLYTLSLQMTVQTTTANGSGTGNVTGLFAATLDSVNRFYYLQSAFTQAGNALVIAGCLVLPLTAGTVVTPLLDSAIAMTTMSTDAAAESFFNLTLICPTG